MSPHVSNSMSCPYPSYNNFRERLFITIFFVANQAKKYSPLGALGAKAIEAAIKAKRVTIWKVFMVDRVLLSSGCWRAMIKLGLVRKHFACRRRGRSLQRYHVSRGKCGQAGLITTARVIVRFSPPSPPNDWLVG